MTLWILFALMTGLAALSILIPLRKGSDRMSAEAANRAADEAVYRAQLDEVDRDAERGLIDAAQAEAARTEIARRLIAAHRQNTQDADGPASRWPVSVTVLIAAVVLPVGALGLYLSTGSPQMPDQPLEARLQADPQGQPVEILVARVERHLADNPSDGQGWEVLGPVYMSLGRPTDAAKAFANSIRLNGATEPRESNLGEALVVAAQGLVTADARAAFERAVALDATAPKPRFFLALALGQEGKQAEAIAAWKALLDGADPAAIWVPAARQELAKLENPGGTAPLGPQITAPALPGPDAQAVEAAAAMSEGDRQQMIRGMVDGLQQRLMSEGGSMDEWLRLIRAQAVLGDREAARDSLARARAALASDPAALDALSRMETEAGLGS
ncbi:c-type cytochrome biogenesis protein CcmI [Microvirga tunisiensis]|uniref:C-type cytochrome biogenesis protein CcmI n=2 Tax=Pannonibacter tanglangensis TaxID=2750084 RepID=A0A7X5F2F9_9HYPH|nr:MULTISPECIES: c-type cytochrome biogenesis protein CcmI [unclassified Pannonibacter]NBN62874.1 c-type cytochrome biogenesis protein CcmI [Pannonibacter sp. XCT-34]NBN78448.1 c-type cytochrome biogenesis protein CcmI [Pannonibacter sp. XCT-53]